MNARTSRWGTRASELALLLGVAGLLVPKEAVAEEVEDNKRLGVSAATGLMTPYHPYRGPPSGGYETARSYELPAALPFLRLELGWTDISLEFGVIAQATLLPTAYSLTDYVDFRVGGFARRFFGEKESGVQPWFGASFGVEEYSYVHSQEIGGFVSADGGIDVRTSSHFWFGGYVGIAFTAGIFTQEGHSDEAFLQPSGSLGVRGRWR